MHKHPNLELLRSFVEVARTENMRQAAQKRCVTQSALSQQILSLESQLGIALFSRASRSLQLTPEGKHLYTSLTSYLEGIDNALRCVGRRKISEGPWRIGVAGSFALRRLQTAMLALSKHHPWIVWEVDYRDDAFAIEQRLARHEIDFSFHYGHTTSEDLQSAPLYEERLVLLAGRSYLDEKGNPNSLESLSRHAFLAFDSKALLLKQWWRSCIGTLRYLPKRFSFCISQIGSMVEATRAGLGLSVVPDHAIPTQSTSTDDWKVLDLPFLQSSVATKPISLSWFATREVSADFSRFRDLLLSELQNSCNGANRL